MKWIKCSERYPPHYVNVLVLFEAGPPGAWRKRIDVAHTADGPNDTWRWEPRNAIGKKRVTHWMPLPKVPK